MKLSDLTGIKNKTELAFDHLIELEEGHLELYFNKTEPFNFRAGEHAIFKIPSQKKGRNWRVFSVASSPKEDFVILGTKTGSKVSPYKKALLDMKKGDLLKLRGPFGSFTSQDNNKPNVFIALGVGITPIRSILKDQAHLNDSTLIYSSKNVFMFDNDFKVLEKEGLTYKKVTDRNELKTQIDEVMTKNLNANVYLSGPSKSVGELSKALKKQGISKKQIITDLFFGY